MFRSITVLAIAATGLIIVATSAWSAAADPTPNILFTPDSSGQTVRVTLSASPAAVAVSMPNMAPGDKTTAPITVTNDGTGTLRYALVSVTTENRLAAQVEFTIKTGVTQCTNAGFGLTGSAAYSAGDLGSTEGAKVIGDSLPGQQAGDRLLAGQASEVLCAQVLLPTGTGNEFQNMTTAATLTVHAEGASNS